MTVPADNPSENDTSDKTRDVGDSEVKKASSEPDGGKALAMAASSPVNPFLAAAADHAEQVERADTPVPPRTLAARMLDYSAHAAIIVGLIGFAWTVSDHVVNRPARPIKGDVIPLAAAAPLPEKAAAQPRDEMAELRQSNQKMHDEIKALKSSIDTLRSFVRRDTTPEQVRMLSAGLDSMKGNLGAMRSETSAAIAQLNGKVDKLQPGRARDLADRVARLEHQAIDPTSTGSIPRFEQKATAPKPPVKPAALVSAPDAHPQADEKPQVVAGWVVRDVYQGVALVEGKRGQMEVVPGVTIPGAGIVKSIERHGSGWTVTTSKGQIAAAAPAQPHNTYRRGPYGGGYGGGGYGGGYRYGY